jgi:hypothetical protein
MSAIAVMLQITEQLVQLLESENEVLMREAPRIAAKTLAKNEPEKRRLVALYERGMMALRGQKLTASAEIDRLKGLIERFRQLMEEHRRRLGALKQVTERLVKAIGDAAQGPMKPVQTYTPTAMMRPAFRAKPASTPLALNRTV